MPLLYTAIYQRSQLLCVNLITSTRHTKSRLEVCINGNMGIVNLALSEMRGTEIAEAR